MKAILLIIVVVILGLGAWLVLEGFRESTPTPPTDSAPLLSDTPLRILLVGDPFATALSEARTELEAKAGRPIHLDVVGYNEVRERTLQAAADRESPYDLISIDVVWMGEYGKKGILHPLDDLLATLPVGDVEDFLPAALRSAMYDGKTLALPIQPHPEILWYRKDLLDAAGLTPPTTTEEVLEVARALHNPEEGMYGICWNALSGQPLGQTMAHLYAAFGNRILDENGHPNLNTPKGIEAARYALALVEVSPPDIFTMAWDERVGRYSEGRAAMTYGWAARAYIPEQSPTSKVKGLTGYLPAPHAPGEKARVPLGVWTLGIPANLPPERLAAAERALVWLTSREQLTLLARKGNGGMPRLSLLRDPELIAIYPAFPAVDAMAPQLDDTIRPAVPEWASLADILGNVYHEMIRGALTPEAAAAEAQRQANLLFGLPEDHAPVTEAPDPM